jgi:hypothetical protein
LIFDGYAKVADRIVGDSIAALGGVRGVDIFLHDSLHTFEHEAAELAAVGPRLTPNALVLSDNAHATGALMRWTERSGRQSSFGSQTTQLTLILPAISAHLPLRR